MSVNFAELTTIVSPGGDAVGVEDNAVKDKPRSRFQQAIEDGFAFAWMSQTYDPDAHDTILGVQNDDPNRDLYIERIIVSSDTASQIRVFGASGVTMAGTAVTGVNLSRSSGRVALATAKCDETGNGEQAGGYATALYLVDVVAVNTLKSISIDGAIRVPYNEMVGVDLTTAATAGNVTIWGWYE